MEEREDFITPAGRDTLEAEINSLISARQAVVARLENVGRQDTHEWRSEYLYRKRHVCEIDRRIRFLHERIESVTVLEPAQQPTDVVCFGALLSLEIASGEIVYVHLVGTDEVAPKQGRIDYTSSLGKMLKGRRIGDTVIGSLNGQLQTIQIRSLRYPVRGILQSDSVANSEDHRAPLNLRQW